MDTHEPLDCACLIHGQVYDWMYVDKLYRGLQRNMQRPVRFHVFTESGRTVPEPMIKHSLQEWPGVQGAKSAWWYKMQMFDPAHGFGRVLYLDLDMVITGSLDWLWQSDPKYIWALRDFKYLWRPLWQGINSSAMIWTAAHSRMIWNDFRKQDLESLRRKYHGDQDYISSLLDDTNRGFFDPQRVVSWRWQVKDGGLDFSTRTTKTPGIPGVIDPEVSMIAFHGRPKPHELQDALIYQHWI